MVANLTALGVKCAVSVWPDVSNASINWKNMSSRGMLIRGEDGRPGRGLQGQFFVDAFNPATRKYQFDQLMQGYGEYGIDTFWLDATEPEGANIGNWYYKFDDGSIHHDTEVAMAWPQQYHRMVREGLEKRAEKRVAASASASLVPPSTGPSAVSAVPPTTSTTSTTAGNNAANDRLITPNDAPSENDLTAIPPFLTRSAFAGSQRYGAILWSGDIESSFAELSVQVQVAQHVAMSGIYLWTTDIGGFRNGDLTDPVFKELIQRWFQFGAFCPIFRLHGDRGGPTDPDKCGAHDGHDGYGYNEAWSFGEEAYTSISGTMALRDTLRPYVQTQLDLASSEGTPVLRPMVFDFRDTDCATAPEQYMFGPDWLVAPVTVYQAKSKKVYLPQLVGKDETWVYHYDASFIVPNGGSGGGWVTVPTTNTSEFPLFHREHA